MRKNLQRTAGKKAGCRAEVHEYRNGMAKVELEVPLDVARRLASEAVIAGGRMPATLLLGPANVEVSVVGARVDSFGVDGKRVGGTGVVEFSSLKEME